MAFLRWNRCALKCFLAISVSVTPFVGATQPYQFSLQTSEAERQIKEYFDDMADREAYDELARFLLAFRHLSISQGLDVPPLAELAQQARDLLKANGIDMPQDLYEHILEVFETEEYKYNQMYGFNTTKPTFELCKHKHKHKNKNKHGAKEEIEMSPKMIFGFCKFLAGTLCSIIPNPITKGVGVALIASGINDMVSEAAEKEKKNHYIPRQLPRTVH